MVESKSDAPGEVITITDGGAAVTIEKENGNFDACLTIDESAERLSISLSAKESRKISTALKEIVSGVKTAQRDRGKSRGWRD